MNIYIFYINGLNTTIDVTATSEKYAYKALWDTLSEEDKNKVLSIECIYTTETI